jgi:hypothetical protein
MEPTTERSPVGLKIGVGEVLVGIGAAAVAVSIVLRWPNLAANQIIYRRTARGVPVKVLWDYTTSLNSTPSLLVVLIPALVLCGLGVVLLRARLLALLGGVLAGAVGAMYIFQAHQVLRANRAASLRGIGLSDFLGPGPYVCIAGGAIAVLGALWLMLRPSS